MNRPHPWSDGYVVAVAWDALFSYRHSWNRIEDVDADLCVEEIDGLLAQVKAAGNPVGPEMPPDLPQGKPVEAQVARLFTLVERVRRAVHAAFAGARALPDHVWATCRFPRTYMTLPATDLAPADEIEIVNLGDLPPRNANWQQRTQVADYPNLKTLILFNMELGRHPFAIDLSRLRHLQCLDLRGNAFDTVPSEVLRCASLRYLALGDNPLTALPDLASLPHLEFLEIPGRRIAETAMAALRRQRPALVIDIFD